MVARSYHAVYLDIKTNQNAMVALYERVRGIGAFWQLIVFYYHGIIVFYYRFYISIDQTYPRLGYTLSTYLKRFIEV